MLQQAQFGNQIPANMMGAMTNERPTLGGAVPFGTSNQDEMDSVQVCLFIYWLTIRSACQRKQADKYVMFVLQRQLERTSIASLADLVNRSTGSRPRSGVRQTGPQSKRANIGFTREANFFQGDIPYDGCSSFW